MKTMKTWPMHLEFIVIIIAITSGLFMFVGRMDRLETKIEDQSRRSDRLYEMFIDLLKEGKK